MFSILLFGLWWSINLTSTPVWYVAVAPLLFILVRVFHDAVIALVVARSGHEDF